MQPIIHDAAVSIYGFISGPEGNIREREWGKLCYSFNDANVAIIYGLKTYYALGFFNGSLLADAAGLLVAPGDRSQAMRRLRFTGLQDIAEREAVIGAYLDNAIQAEKDDLKAPFLEKDEMPYPQELIAYLEEDSEFESAFERLTPGRRRGHLLNYVQVKQSKTRIARIERSRGHVLDGKGPNGR